MKNRWVYNKDITENQGPPDWRHYNSRGRHAVLGSLVELAVGENQRTENLTINN